MNISLKILPILLLGFLIIPAYAQVDIFTDHTSYSDNDPLFIYGKALPNESLIIRLVAPDETIALFDQILTDDFGQFSYLLLRWPDTSVDLPYGTYTVEVISTLQNGLSNKTQIKYSSTAELIKIPIDRDIRTQVFAPESSAVNSTIRVFVQTTSDGLLIGQDRPDTLLHTSHVHLPDDTIHDIDSSFLTLHNGLYYVDYIPMYQGTYVFHVVSFSQGTVSHGSAATSVISHDLGGISDEITRLNTVLHEASGELDTLKGEVSTFGVILDRASTNIDSSVAAVSASVKNVEEASTQLNSLLFPVVASIGIIVALQIAILARRR